ncbi:hypothetical protein niasHT_006714 [Heterodera trifolii]|uniref:Triple functional domain protein n=1 Tax=Heterodera trifolii TaxID=157864 RepID=A0ABD2LWK6_9BILA
MLNNVFPQCHVPNRAEDIEHVLRERVALLPGVRDREGRPIIFVPAREINSHPDHLRNLLTYLYEVTQDDAKTRGFTFVIDMRRGTTWEIVKPILKILQEYFPALINCVYIVKPDKILEKYKISTTKYKFDVQMISLEAMPKYIDFCQIIREFGGSLPYDHDEWIELRKDIERILQRMCEILKNLDRISTEMDNAEMPIDVQSSQTSIAKHQDLYPIITAVPMDEFTSEIQSLRDRVIISGHKQSVGSRNGSVLSSPNPDLLSVFPQIEMLKQNLDKQRGIVYAKWDYRKKDLDRYFQLKLFEKDAEELSKWICSHLNVLSHRFVLIGECETETNRLLKEHKDFADSVNTSQVSYEQVITVSHRLLQQFQFIGVNRIESISQQLQADWDQFVGMIVQRTALLQITLNMHRKCDIFLKNAKRWLPNVGVDPNSIRSEDELSNAMHRHNEFQKMYQTAYSEAFEETSKLARVLKKYFGESVQQFPTWQLIEEQTRQITRTNRELHSIWAARNDKIKTKLSSNALNHDLKSVLSWLTEHGEPFMRRKFGIGIDRTTAAQFCETHDKFRTVAHNTNRNAEQIFHLVRDLEEPRRTETLKRVEELRQRIDKFRRCIDHRTNLLCLSSNFFLHYDEIMNWYFRMENRIDFIQTVPESVELCEQNKEKFQSENDGTVQAYERVMVESQQLLQSLKKQRELLEVDNSEAACHVHRLTRDIEMRHQQEKERWHNQRFYLNAALNISVFLRDCEVISIQLENWRQDLEGLRHSVARDVEVFKQFHTDNTVKVRQIVSDAMKKQRELLQSIRGKNLQLVFKSAPKMPLNDIVTAAANQLHNLQQEGMQIAMDVSERIELGIQLGALRHCAKGVISAIDQHQMALRQMFFIPGNQQEVAMENKNYDEFRVGIEATEENVSRFYEEKEKFSNLPTLTLELHAETRVKAENLNTEVKTKWQALIGLVDLRKKLLSAADSYYKYTIMIVPTSQSIEHDLLVEVAECGTLKLSLQSIQERIDRHRIHKERFLQSSVYAQQTADQFIRQIRRCDAPREHMEMRLFEVQRCKETVRERQNFIFEMWKSTNNQLEQCREVTKIQLMAKEVMDWSDREMDICAEIKCSVDQLNKDGFDHHTTIEQLLVRCLAQWDLFNVEFQEMNSLLKATKQFVAIPQNKQHLAEVKNACSSAKAKFDSIWRMLVDCEQAVRTALSLDEANIQRRKAEQEKLSLDRFSDSTIDEKLSDPNGIILEPMKELLKTEKDYIEDMRRCVDIYLYAYRTSGSMCPMAIRGKEREIFGNIEELYQFHSSVFLNELMAYALNPEDVGYCFIEWMEKLKELYADYCLNKEENNYLICLPETIKIFNEIREQNGLDISHDLQSLVIKPVQRVTKYHILLKELLKHCSKSAKEIKNAHEIVLSIPKLANDRMHLKSFENSQAFAVGDFVMQDSFLVSEPKRYFKRERELQVFLFESNIVFTKKEEMGSKKMGYVHKDSFLLREIHVVEHIEGDNSKFGLRKSAFPYQNDQNTTVLKANSETVRIAWVKMLRDLKLEIGRQQKNDDKPLSLTSVGGTNRSSRDSQSSLMALFSSSVNGTTQTTEDRNSTQSMAENVPFLLYSTNNEQNHHQQQQQQVVFRHEAGKRDNDSGGRGKSIYSAQFTSFNPSHITFPNFALSHRKVFVLLMDHFHSNNSTHNCESDPTKSKPISKVEETSTSIVFYSPNALPANLKLSDTEHISRSRPELSESTRDSLAPFLSPSLAPFKLSSSMVDLLPSRFPTDIEDAKNGVNAEESKSMINETMTTTNHFFCSTPMFSSISEEDSEMRTDQSQCHGVLSAPPPPPPTHSHSSPQMQCNRRRTSTISSANSNNLHKIFKSFREQLEKTKVAFRNSLTESEQRRENRRRMSSNSRSFPISSSSMSSIHDYWKSLMQRESRSNQQRQPKLWLVTEDFTAERLEQLTVFSGQRVELLSHQGDHGDFVRVTLSLNNASNNHNNASSSGGRSKASGFVPRRILVATASQPNECDSPSGVSAHSPADETHSMANPLNAKRTSIRRFFSSNQSTSKASSHHHQQHHRPPSNPNVALDLPCSSSLDRSSSSSFHSSAVASTSTGVVDLLPASSSSPPVLSAVCNSSSLSHPSSFTTATTTAPRPLPSSVATRSIDPDLPPPMDQLSSAVDITEEHQMNGDGPAQQPSTSEMAIELNNNNACASTEEATSSSPNAANLTDTPSGEAMSGEESARLKRSYVLQELVESERTYVQDLASISDGYIASLREMELSDEDREKVKIIFANIEQILDFHKTFFLKEIEKSLNDYEASGNSFIKYERRLHTFYVKYCQNKPKSDFLVSQDYFEQLFFDIKEKLGHKVALSDLLIKPVQRITKYQLMLSDILKYTHRSGDNAEVLERAHDIMRVVPKACDDMMQVGRLQNFQGNLNAQGRLTFQGTLFISDGGVAQPFKGKERRVFLFEQSVIIAECIPPRKEYGNPTYNFKNQIMVNKMMLDEKVPDEPLRFVLQSSDPNQQATYVAQAASVDDKEQWLAKLSAQLDQQKTFLNALVDPKRYQNQLANSIGVISLGGKKDSAGSLGTPTSPAPSFGGGTSPTKPLAAPHKSASSKLFGFGKSK